MLSYFADFFLDNGTVHYGYLYDFHILIFYAYLNVCEPISSKITWTSKWLFYYLISWPFYHLMSIIVILMRRQRRLMLMMRLIVIIDYAVLPQILRQHMRHLVGVFLGEKLRLFR